MTDAICEDMEVFGNINARRRRTTYRCTAVETHCLSTHDRRDARRVETHGSASLHGSRQLC